MQYFNIVVAGDRFTVRKPNPKHLLGTLELMNRSGGPAVMIGDSKIDVDAARKANLPIVAVSYGYTKIPPRNLGADILVDHFTELPLAVNKLCP